MSTLDELFARMQEAALRKEQDSEAERAVGMPWESPRIAAPVTGTGARIPTCRCSASGGIFLETMAGKRRYAVCPACNPRSSCKHCDGTGHERRFNLLTQMEDVVPFGCVCTALEKSVERMREAGIPDRYLSVDFDTLSFDHLAPAQRDKLTKLAQWAEHYCTRTAEACSRTPQEVESPFLTFMGPVGTGKTHLAVAALRRFILRHGMNGRFVDFSRFLGELRHSYSAKTSEEGVLGPLRNVDVLLLDELGKGRTENEWQLEKLDELINSRYNTGKITLLTTNYLHGNDRYDPRAYGLAEIPANESFWKQSLQERIGARMYDRLVEASEFLVFLGVDSYRRRMLEELVVRGKESRAPTRS
jgi:DNA replication protein DnaC